MFEMSPELEILFFMVVIQDLFFMIVIQLLCIGYQTIMDMAWLLLGYGSDIEGGGDSLLGLYASLLLLVTHKKCDPVARNMLHCALHKTNAEIGRIKVMRYALWFWPGLFL